MRFFLTTLLILAALGPAEAQELTLRLRPEEGRTYRTRIVTEIDVTQTVMGQSMDNHQVTTSVMAYEILSVDEEGVASTRVTYESMKFQQTGPIGRIEYDSSNPPAIMDEATRAYSVMVGRSFHMKLGPDGSVSEVEGMAELMEELLADIPTPDFTASMRGSIEDMFGDDMFETGIGGLMFPGHAVSVGDTWTGIGSAQGVVPMILATTWTLSDRRDGIAYMDVRSVVGEGEPGVIEMGPMSVTYDMSGGASGTVEIDERTGWTIRSSMVGAYSGTTTIDMPGLPGGPMTSPLTMTISTAAELLPDRGND